MAFPTWLLAIPSVISALGGLFGGKGADTQQTQTTTTTQPDTRTYDFLLPFYQMMAGQAVSNNLKHYSGWGGAPNFLPPGMYQNLDAIIQSAWKDTTKAYKTPDGTCDSRCEDQLMAKIAAALPASEKEKYAYMSDEQKRKLIRQTRWFTPCVEACKANQPFEFKPTSGDILPYLGDWTGGMVGGTDIKSKLADLGFTSPFGGGG